MTNSLDKEITLVEEQKQRTPTRPERAVLSIPKISLDGVAMADIPTPRDEYDPTSHPASPFYSHVTTRTSMEQLKSASSLGFHHYDTDLEAGSGRPSCDAKITHSNTRHSKQMSQMECSVWPQPASLKRKYKEKKKQRGCYPWNRLNRKQKWIARVLLLLVIIGIGVGVGVGVSQAVGGTWYKSANEQSKVGQTKR